MSKLGTGATGAILRAAIWLPFCFGVAVIAGQPASAQTTGLPPVVSGDCSASNAGVLTCTKSAGAAFAASATVDATNAANISSGNLPVARLATALASPTAIGVTAPNVARIAADTNSTQNFTQWFTATNAAGTGTQPGSTGISPGLSCEGFWTVVSGTTVRASATCVDGATNFYWFSAAAAAFGSEAWTQRASLNASGTLALSGASANFLGRTISVANGTASAGANTASVDFSSGARLRGGGATSTTYGSSMLLSETSTGVAGASFACSGSSGTGTTAGSCTSSVNLVQPLYTPASSTESCTAGKSWDDANFHYVCTATNTIKRAALAAF
ncbi:hypothetical protein Terro_0131 [Terriglobus roseus DSM 18391]|uniref:Uncharacterized protein n=1 Tax=Terriglobus roseus (strain DSM 18391 / NRRL B-41598 / KBS 63) TaxID=926566 RepID=I3ZB64_TERRK|nr:hypothetical protein [Terriglobus roseus]AFL86482.1 hypothetical protein Terro_0131 [Terriglobus roseus DSM 18391]